MELEELQASVKAASHPADLLMRCCPIENVSAEWDGGNGLSSRSFRIQHLYFSVRGGGRGSPRRQEGGGGRWGFLLKIPGEGGGVEEGRGRGAGRVSAANWGILGRRGAKFFFFGAAPSNKSRSFRIRPFSEIR